MKNIEYIKFIPSGNNTALVINKNYNKKDKKIINDYILNIDKTIEQVGFIDKNKYKLSMAGGEFCGNALRCATLYYLNGKEGNIKIKINNRYIQCGIDNNNLCYCEIPIIKRNQFKKINNDYIVKLDKIVFIIIDYKVNISNKYIKEYSLNLIKKYKLDKYKASGVIYINKNKIKPIIYVKDINTLFIETACGSGTASVGIYKSYIYNKDIQLDILQPSRKVINVKTYYNKYVKKVIIKGIVESSLNVIKIDNI